MGKTISNGRQPQFFRHLSAGASQVGTKDDSAILLKEVAYSGERGPQSLVVGGDYFNALLDGYIEVNPDQYPLARYIQLG